jgi:nucleotide-binding universal stress UspA family protein
MANTSRYLVCVNEKSHSKTALAYACTKAKTHGCEVDMLYIIDPVDYNTIFSVADVIKQERYEDAQKLFTELQATAKELHNITPTGVVREGRISEEIINQIVENEDTVLLLIGVAADGSSSNQLISQLSSELGSSFQIPLLFVPGDLTQKQINKLNNQL